MFGLAVFVLVYLSCMLAARHQGIHEDWVIIPVLGIASAAALLAMWIRERLR
jgi:hypothetical protein